MSTGPEHYRKAGELVEAARAYAMNSAEVNAAIGAARPVDVPTAVALTLAEAQVHATLALAAATAANDPDPTGTGQVTAVSREWATVIMPQEATDGR